MDEKLVIFDIGAGEFMCTEVKDNNLYCAKYDVTYHMVLDFGGFKVIHRYDKGVEYITELINLQIDKMRNSIYENTLHHALVSTLFDMEHAMAHENFIPYFIDNYRALLIDSLNAAFNELESK